MFLSAFLGFTSPYHCSYWVSTSIVIHDETCCRIIKDYTQIFYRIETLKMLGLMELYSLHLIHFISGNFYLLRFIWSDENLFCILSDGLRRSSIFFSLLKIGCLQRKIHVKCHPNIWIEISFIVVVLSLIILSCFCFSLLLQGKFVGLHYHFSLYFVSANDFSP